ncbi:MAG: hypothetical protein ABI064_07430 [Acidobacteriaceae bacterium]
MGQPQPFNLNADMSLGVSQLEISAKLRIPCLSGLQLGHTFSMCSRTFVEAHMIDASRNITLRAVQVSFPGINRRRHQLKGSVEQNRMNAVFPGFDSHARIEIQVGYCLVARAPQPGYCTEIIGILEAFLAHCFIVLFPLHQVDAAQTNAFQPNCADASIPDGSAAAGMIGPISRRLFPCADLKIVRIGCDWRECNLHAVAGFFGKCHSFVKSQIEKFQRAAFGARFTQSTKSCFDISGPRK